MAKQQNQPPMEVVLDTRQQVRLKNRDLIDFQRVVGTSLLAWGAELERKVKDSGGDQQAQAAMMGDVDWTAMTALLWIIGRRNNSGFTWEDALDAEVDEASMMGLYDLLADPTVPADTAAT